MSLSSGARTNDQDLGDILLATHIIEEPALAQARRESKRTGRPLWRLLTRDGQVTEDALFRALRQEVRVPVLAADQLKSVVVPPELREALPHKVAQRLGILPLERSTDGRRAAMAMIDPTADISAMWPTFTALGVTEVRRFLVHPSTLRLGLEFFYGVPWQDEHEQAGDVDLAEVTPIIPRSAITQPLSAPTAQPPASVMVDPRLQDEFARMDGPTDPSARAMRSGGGQSEPMFSLARAAITGEVPRLVAPGLVSDSKRELLSAVTPRRAEASSASLRPVSPSKVPVSAPAIAAAASISGEMSAYRARREISIPELQASDIMLDEDQPMKLDPESMMPQSEPVQEALIKVCDLVLATLERELHVKRPEAMSRLAQALGHGAALAGIHTVAPTGAQLAADPAGARALLEQACRDAVRQLGAQAVIVGGAGLAGMAAAIQPGLDVPLIDSVQAGARWALRTHTPPPERAKAGFDVPWHHLSPELTALGTPAG